MAYALELGYRLIDTACDYGSQAGVGAAIRAAGVGREAVYLVIKVEETDDAYSATRAYLAPVGVSYADLVLIDRPPQHAVGEALWRGLVRAHSEGQARAIGVSNYSVEQLQALYRRVKEWPAVNQIEWTPFGHSAHMPEFCRQHAIGVQAYSPLTRGERLDYPRLRQIGERHEKSAAQVLIRCNLQLGTVPLPKANQRGHLRENLDVFAWRLSDQEMTTLSSLNDGYSSLGTLPYS